jgi:adenylate kinase
VTRVALSGTPGTGKTSVSEAVQALTDVEVVHLNEVVREHDLVAEHDLDRDSLVADIEAVGAWLDDYRNESDDGGDLLVESHLSHLLDVEKVIVLRCHPESLKPRLRERGESEATIAENAESEALDLILAEAVEMHGEDSVWEINTTDRPPEAVAEDVVAAIEGELAPRVGVVDFVEYL